MYTSGFKMNAPLVTARLRLPNLNSTLNMLLLLAILSLSLFSSHDIHAADDENQSVVKQIELMAQRHAKTGSPLKTEVALEIFRENSSGLTAFQISKIYEDAY